MLEPHLNIFNNLKWDDVYEHWDTDELKHYWRELDLTILPRDLTFINKGFEEALVLAKDGDERAVYQLNRIIRRDSSTDMAKKAIVVLEELNV